MVAESITAAEARRELVDLRKELALFVRTKNHGMARRVGKRIAWCERLIAESKAKEST